MARGENVKITKWHIIGIVVLAIILGVFTVPVVPTDEGNKTVSAYIAKKFSGGSGKYVL
jgi:hypothetical protein